MHPVQLAPLYGTFNEAILTLLSGLAIWLSAYAKQWLSQHAKLLGEQTDAQLAAGLNRALQNGVAIGMQKLDELERQYPGMPVKNQVSAWAAQYAVDHSPAAVEHFTGLTMDDLALKALAYLPPVRTDLDPGAGLPRTVAPVETKPLGLLK